MEQYIKPIVKKYKKINELLENNNRNNYLFDHKDNLSIENLLQENFVCIVGEPGIGKSRLLNEVKNKISDKQYFFCTASEFITESVTKNIKYCIIDALDEVDGNLFYRTLQLIKQYHDNNSEVNVLFTCRKHYIASYVKYFELFNDLTFAELCRLSKNDMKEAIKGCSQPIIDNVNKSSKLQELLTIPRYLTFLLECEKQKGSILNIGELFEFIIDNSIKTAIESYKRINYTESLRILVKRVLEKIAFVMEISRKDQISKDELYTILDEVKGNMTQMFISNVDLLFFENRILKETNCILQFENTELQEYLAAKELCRQDNIESVLYDIAVHKELKHIYPNWYDVIPHISYNEDKIPTFINIVKLILSYESIIESETIESLVKYIDTSILEYNQKEELFLIILEHYLRFPRYIIWRSQVSRLMQDCYTSNCSYRLIMPFEILNKIQIANVCTIIDEIAEKCELDNKLYNCWLDAANNLIQDNDGENQLLALRFYKALKNEEKLISLSEKYSSFSKKVKEKYCEVTGYGRLTSNNVVDCWVNGCFERNPYSINAVLCIEDPSAIFYAYNIIIENNKLHEFYNSQGTFHVFYEIHLDKQFNILWNYNNSDGKKLITKIIASYIDNNLYINHGIICPIVKRILLEKEYGNMFVKCFGREWKLKDIFDHFDEELVDAEFLNVLEKVLHESKVEEWRIDDILKYLTNKIRKDESKKDSIFNYIERYAETFKKWDDDSKKKAESRYDNPDCIEAYKNLSDPAIPMKDKYEMAYMLSQKIEFTAQQSPRPLINVISSFFNEIDLNKLTIEKTGNTSYNISIGLIKIRCFIKLLVHLGYNELINQNKILLAKTLPIVCLNTDFDTREIIHIYKSIIKTISEQEKSELVLWWKSRDDDFINVSPDSIFTCIEEYGIDAFSYKLEEYIDEYIKRQNLDNRLNASKSLELISKGYCNWDIEKYRRLFNVLENDGIEGIKIECNAIMIEKYQDIEAIQWRVEYLKNNVVKYVEKDIGGFRSVSIEESEITSPNPYMFRCFMNIKGNEKLNELLYDLFDFALELSIKNDTLQYSIYLLDQIYHFFINTDNIHFLLELRKKVENFNATNVNYSVNNIMNNAENVYLQKEKTSINKSIKLYNKCIKDNHLEIRNNGDLRRYFSRIQCEVQKEIQDQGIYALVRQENLNEDFIQRELKNTIINKCCQMGLETIQIDREVTLQDNKRTDLLVRYGMCNPIMIELKLLNNNEIQNDKERQEYKHKFIQYTRATNACLSVFWVFNVHKNNSKIENFDKLVIEYKDLNNTLVVLTDCKCSSGVETGMSPKQANLPKSKKNENS